MSEQRRPGMDNPYYTYSALPDRPPLKLPGGARVAMWVLLNLEYWEIVPPEDALKDPRTQGELGAFFPDYRNHSQREHGMRIGIFRVLELLDRYGLKATVAINTAACERYPYLIEQCKKRGYEFAAHGDYASRMISSKMPEADERALIADGIAAVEKATGQRPAGWHSQEFGESALTPALLAEAGLSYIMDWANDDQPYMMTAAGKSLVAVPYQAEWDDVQMLWFRRVPMPRYPELVQEAFDTLYDEGAESGRTFSMGLHPWMIGQGHRIRYLDEALQRITGRDGVWQPTAGEIADWFRAEHTA